MKRVFSLSLICFVAFISFGFLKPVMALDCSGDGTCPSGYTPEQEQDGSTTRCVCKNMFGGDDVDSVGEQVGLENTTLPKIIGNVVKAVLGLFGVVATVIIVFGGVKWMTSQGDTQKIDSAKKLMIAGAIGMLLIVSGYAITSFLISNLVKVVE